MGTRKTINECEAYTAAKKKLSRLQKHKRELEQELAKAKSPVAVEETAKAYLSGKKLGRLTSSVDVRELSSQLAVVNEAIKQQTTIVNAEKRKAAKAAKASVQDELDANEAKALRLLKELFELTTADNKLIAWLWSQGYRDLSQNRVVPPNIKRAIEAVLSAKGAK